MMDWNTWKIYSMDVHKYKDFEFLSYIHMYKDLEFSSYVRTYTHSKMVHTYILYGFPTKGHPGS